MVGTKRKIKIGQWASFLIVKLNYIKRQTKADRSLSEANFNKLPRHILHNIIVQHKLTFYQTLTRAAFLSPVITTSISAKSNGNQDFHM